MMCICSYNAVINLYGLDAYMMMMMMMMMMTYVNIGGMCIHKKHVYMRI